MWMGAVVLALDLWNVKEGGVGIVADKDRLTEVGEDLNWPTAAQAEYARLKESGRWVAAIVPLGSGKKQMLVQTFYGPQRSEEDPFRKSVRENLLQTISIHNFFSYL